MTLLAGGTSALVSTSAVRAMAFPGDTPVGALAVMAITSNGSVNPTSVTDDAAGAGAANSWSMMLTSTNANNSVTTSIWVCKLTRALSAANTVTATYASSRQCHAAVLAGFSDVVTSTALDGQIATATATGDTPAVGPTGDPVAPRVIVLFCVGSTGSVDGMTPLGTTNVIGAVRSLGGSTATARFTGLAYEYRDDPGPISASATVTNAGNPQSTQWNAGLGTIAVPSNLPPASSDLLLGSIAI